MTNHYENCKQDVINEIVYNLDICDVLTLYDIRRIIKEYKPLFIRDYIDKHWGEYSEGFRDDLEHEIRKFWLKTGPGCKREGYLINPYDTDQPECWLDICIANEPADIWVMEQGTSFNPVDIASALFQIYMGKVVFKK